MALGLAVVFAAFMTWDLAAMWGSQDEYAYGWLTPVFVAYVVWDRWPRITAALRSPDGVSAGGWQRSLLNTLAALMLGVGLVFFVGGAAYRIGWNLFRACSLAMVIGFPGILLSLVYFNSAPAPAGVEGKPAPSGSSGFMDIFRDRQVRMAGFFLFPALIWLVSIPLGHIAESAIKLFLLNKVVTVVSFTFDLLGLPVEQQGNVLVLPNGQVGVADACSGIRSLTGCIFAGAFLGAVFVERWWRKILLLVCAICLAVVTNMFRSLFLTGWAYAYGSDAIEGTVHDVTGYGVLVLTSIGLICLLPVINFSWERWLERQEASRKEGGNGGEASGTA